MVPSGHSWHHKVGSTVGITGLKISLYGRGGLQRQGFRGLNGRGPMFTELHIYFQLELLSKIHGHCSSVTNQAMKVTGNKHVNRKQATGLQRWLSS